MNHAAADAAAAPHDEHTQILVYDYTSSECVHIDAKRENTKLISLNIRFLISF